jgi:TolB-like protein/DNA-binding SARP family transcriptional activator/Tfp pilus assembly protein PilF
MTTLPQEEAMAFVLQFFGGFRLVGEDGKPVSLPDRARALLAYLATAPSAAPRQLLAELLSAEGDAQEQRTTLRQAVYLVRKAMADAVICTQEGGLVLNGELVSADVRLFQSAIARCDDRSLADAVELYRGPFLDGERSPSSAFEEWLVARRREFLEHTLEALIKLAGSDAAAGLHSSALARGRRALALDPLREDIHRQVMRNLAAMGQRSNALRQYEIVRHMLAEELDVAPEAETEALREAIARGAEPDPSGRTAAAPATPRNKADGSEVAHQASPATRSRTAPVRPASWLFAGTGSSPALARLPLALAIMSLLIVGAGLLWLAAAPRVASPPTASLPDAHAIAGVPRLSIVVLPFANLSGDPDQEYFADGITDDLTTDLSRIDGSFVISRHTAFAYKGKEGVDVREVGHELGIRYVLEGSVRPVGEQVLINAQLIDAATAEEVWSERFEGSRGDLSALHNEVTGRIAATLRLELTEAEGRRVERDHQPDPEAADDALRGWAILYRPYSRENRAVARRLFERAIAKDPNTVSALVGLAHVLEGYSTSPVEDRQRADELLRRALDLEPNRAATYFVLGKVRSSQGRMPEAADAFQTAIKLDRNYARAYLYLGLTLMHLGHPEKTVELAQHAMRLNPRDPNIADHLVIIGAAQILLGRADEAIENLKRANAANPRLWYVHLHLAAAYGMTQRIDDAKRELAEHLRLRPEFTSLAAIKAAMPLVNAPAYLALAERTIFVGLRRAGLPD